MEQGALQRENEEKENKEQKIPGKEKIHPNSHTVSQPGSVGPSVSGAGGLERQVTDLNMIVVATRSEMVSGRPSRDAGVDVENTASPISPAGEPLEMSPGERPTELQRAGISSVVRLWGAVVELQARVRGGQLCSLVDSGSTGNYISDQCLATLNIPMVPEDEHKNLTLADGSIVQAQGYAQYMLRCGDFKCPIIARVFPNLQQELILGMPWLIQENPNIDWAARTVRVTRREVIHNLPTIRPAIGGATDELESKVNCTSAKAFKQAIRKRRIKEDTVFLGLIQKVQEPTEQVDVAQ